LTCNEPAPANGPSTRRWPWGKLDPVTVPPAKRCRSTETEHSERELFKSPTEDSDESRIKELRAIDAAEAIRETGKALREWFKDLRDHVRDQAKETELDEKMTREAERDAVREGETQARRDRDASAKSGRLPT
jgi:hypothetical protein